MSTERRAPRQHARNASNAAQRPSRNSMEMHGFDDMRQRVGRLETEMSEVSSKVSGAVHDIASMRSSQDGIGVKLDALISSVADMKAKYTEPVNLLDVAGKVVGIVVKSMGIFTAIVAGIFFLIQHYTAQDKLTKVAAGPPSAQYVTIDGKKYRVTQQP